MGEKVKHSTPAEEDGIYWGYRVRYAQNLRECLRGGPGGPYDFSIGTSEGGIPVESVENQSDENMILSRHYEKLMIVFGNVRGLEDVIEKEKSGCESQMPEDIFDLYLNILPGQRSRTIRTEEALPLALMAFRMRNFFYNRLQ
eukprot:GHVO01054046.1.p1 GENE.GHVO01054046.1~~GHVO01054046.1.p1  ORF type:complete len:143 (-),score=33.09 GHVO01054046.1:134-562(-)